MAYKLYAHVIVYRVSGVEMRFLKGVRLELVLSCLLIYCFASTGSAEPAFNRTHQLQDQAQRGIYALAAPPISGARPFSEYAGRYTIVMLFQPHCGFCRAQYRQMEALLHKHSHLQIAAIGIKGNSRDLSAEVRKAQTQIPSYVGSPELVKALGGPRATPIIYLINQNGQAVYVKRGYHNQPMLEQLVRR